MASLGPSFATSLEFHDPDAFATSIHNCHVKRFQTEGGAFQARIALLRLPDVNLCLAHETTARRATFSFPPDRIFLRFVAAGDLPKTRNRVLDLPGTLMVGVGAPEVEDEIHGPAISRSLSMPIMPMLSRAEIQLGSTPRFLFEGTANLRPPPAQLARLVRLHEEMVRAAEAREAHVPGPRRTAAMSDGLLEMIFHTLASVDEPPSGRSARRGHAAMRRVMDYIHAHADRRLTLGELCAVARCSAKTLETIFLASVGETPIRYLARWRMWQVHRLLGAGDSTEARVSDIALHYGFWQLGRFAVAYRAMFGESPSVTLARGKRVSSAARTSRSTIFG